MVRQIIGHGAGSGCHLRRHGGQNHGFRGLCQILPGTDGLVHISQLANHRVTKVSDVVKEGDRMKVKVLEIGRDGKIRLSHKAAAGRGRWTHADR